MILYHGSPVKVPNPDVLHSRSRVDFGKGFSRTYLLMREGVSDLHCMSDGYLADELKLEYGLPLKAQ